MTGWHHGQNYTVIAHYDDGKNHKYVCTSWDAVKTLIDEVKPGNIVRYLEIA